MLPGARTMQRLLSDQHISAFYTRDWVLWSTRIRALDETSTTALDCCRLLGASLNNAVVVCQDGWLSRSFMGGIRRLANNEQRISPICPRAAGFHAAGA